MDCALWLNRRKIRTAAEIALAEAFMSASAAAEYPGKPFVKLCVVGGKLFKLLGILLAAVLAKPADKTARYEISAQ